LNVAALATIAKAGAAQNYYIEVWLATVLLAAIALSAAIAEDTPALPAQLLVLIAAAAVAHYASGWAHRLHVSIREPARAADFRTLWDQVAKADGPILSENLAALVVNRKPVIVEPFGMLLLTRTGFFAPDRIVRDCEAGRFALVVLEYRLEELGTLGECLGRRYAVSEVLPPYRLLRPRPRL
jgi:hypothetical protein